MNAPSRVDLTNCDREPIHIPGSIQSHGGLIACDATAGTIRRHSTNLAEMIGVSRDCNGRDLAEVLGEDAAHSVRNALARTQEGSRAALLFGQVLPNGRRFDVSVHRFKGNAIIELEPADASIAPPLELARAMIGRITTIETVDRLIRDTARLIQGMLHYDRVMIYSFGADGAGKVLSEARRGDLESFLGQYFPASDIPQQARSLYLKNTIRIISNSAPQPVPVEPVLDASGEPLDLSFAHLRSVSPIHCEYLRNMGVGASMSISIVVEGELWGLIACHHYSPRTLTMAERVAAEMFGQFFSLHLEALQRKQSLEAATRARALLDRFLRETSRSNAFGQILRERLPDFRELIPSDGQAIWIDGKWTASGTVPPASAAPSLVRFAEAASEGGVWATHQLSAVLPGAEEYAADASGMLIIPLSQRPRDYLFFFRKELVRTLDWAGNPDKVYETGPLGDRLTPRKSFAIWKETVRLQSAPWTAAERQFAEATRAALVEVALQHSELLADERSKAELRQRMLNEELNHRVKNILAVIKSLVSQPSETDHTLEEYVQSLRGRIQALSHAHDQVIRGDGGGGLGELVRAELSPYGGQGRAIELNGPAVWLDAQAFSVMALVLHEMSTNAAKYGALSRPGGTLKLDWSVDETGALQLQWTETGGPPVRPPSRRGFGTVLIDRSVPFDLGGQSSVSYNREGVTASFRVPGRFVSTERASAARATVDAPVARQTHGLGGRRILIVEDQMLIALDLEQMLTDAGLDVVATAPTVREALSALERHGVDAAILDVNLGAESSAEIADALAARGTPFLFATGYGDGGSLPERHSGVAVVRKPYEAAAIMQQLHRLLGTNIS
jgi:light-regulated signal transduction histidine kinase (bacteriophytochrome)